MAFIACDNCTYVRQFMAVGIGLIDKDKSDG